MRSLLDTGRIVDQDGMELMSGLEVRYFYEVSRIKDSELIQRLVDALNNIGVNPDVVNWDDCADGHIAGEFDFGDARAIVKSLAAAEAAGFKPSSR